MISRIDGCEFQWGRSDKGKRWPVKALVRGDSPAPGKSLIRGSPRGYLCNRISLAFAYGFRVSRKKTRREQNKCLPGGLSIDRAARTRAREFCYGYVDGSWLRRRLGGARLHRGAPARQRRVGPGGRGRQRGDRPAGGDQVPEPRPARRPGVHVAVPLRGRIAAVS